MNKRADTSVKVRCHSCRKIFVLNLVKAQDIQGGNRVEMSRPCPYCAENNLFEVEKNMAPVDTVYRKVISGRKVT